MGNGDDLIYLFPILMGTFRPLSHEDLVFSERFIKLLTNFATDGKPSLTMESGKEILVEALSGFDLGVEYGNTGCGVFKQGV